MSLADFIDNNPPPASIKRVLVAESDPAACDLLKTALSQRRHQVDIAYDGEEALKALRSVAYDLALLDLELPTPSSLRVAAMVRGFLNQAARPLFVAMTAATEGLVTSGDDCDGFDLVVSKPLDFDGLCDLVEHACEAPPGHEEAGGPIDHAEGAKSDVESFSGALAILCLGYQYLSWPDDLDAARMSDRAMVATRGEASFDVLLVKQPARPEELAPLWQHKYLHLLPVVDLVGALGASADLDASTLAYGGSASIHALVKGFHERRAGLHGDLVGTADLAEKLLGRVFLSGGRLVAHREAGERLGCFNTTLEPATAMQMAEQARVAGNLELESSDRLGPGDPTRPASAARAPCAACGCPLRRRDDRACARCGEDLDQPPGEVTAYRLTTRAMAFLGEGRNFLRPDQPLLRLCELPRNLAAAVREQTRRFGSEVLFTLLEFEHRNERQIVREHGRQSFARARNLFVETLREQLRNDDVVAKDRARDFALLGGASPAEARRRADTICSEAAAWLHFDLGTHVAVFGPQDIVP